MKVVNSSIMTLIFSHHELTRICTSLEADNKRQRKHALEEIMRNVFEKKEAWSSDEVLKLWLVLDRPLARLLSDQTEACRDNAVELLQKFLTTLPVNDKNILYLMPVLSRRLSAQEYIEQSEEVRLKCVRLLKIIIAKYKEFLAAYMDDIIGILSRGVVDNYPNVKRESCECISEVAQTVPNHFYSYGENLVKPILTNFTHQHHKIRAISVRTIGDVLQYGHSKCMEEVATPLAERLFDQSGAVRAAVIDIAGNWLVKLRDRYSWWHKILPLLLTGLHDEIESIRVKAGELWDAAGRQFIEENLSDERFKDKLEYFKEELDHYPPHVARPNLGCRTIAQRNLCKLVNGIGHELTDWKPDIRVRSAQLLCVLILNVEIDVVQHIQKLLYPMYRACNDEDTRVVVNVELAAEYLGYFVPPDVYCRLVVPTLEESPTAGHLRVFAAILRGSECSTLLPEIERIATFLRQDHICQSRKNNYQEQILSCCNSLLLVCGKNCSEVSQDLFTVIFTVLSMTTESAIQKEANRLLNVLVDINSLADIDELHRYHIGPILKSISNGADGWIIFSPEALIFWSILMHASTAAVLHMHLILQILKNTMTSDGDPEVRLKQFITLSEYFLYNKTLLAQLANLDEFVETILNECIIPSLIWSAGRTAEAIRTAALGCLCALLQNDKNSCTGKEHEYNITLFNTAESFTSVFQKLSPILVTLADDCAKKTRLYSLRAICLIMAIGQDLCCITEEHINKIYPVVMKRLDDGSDDIREAAIEALVEIWDAAPKDYDTTFNRGHVDALYTTTIIHLDDPESKFQRLMLDALLKLAKIHPELLHQKLQNCRTNFRNQDGIDKVLNHCQDILNKC